MAREIDFRLHQARMSAGDGLHLVDIRSATEVGQGVLPGAGHLPMHLLAGHMSAFPADKDVVPYCHSGARSLRACS